MPEATDVPIVEYMPYFERGGVGRPRLKSRAFGLTDECPESSDLPERPVDGSGRPGDGSSGASRDSLSLDASEVSRSLVRPVDRSGIESVSRRDCDEGCLSSLSLNAFRRRAAAPGELPSANETVVDALPVEVDGVVPEA